MPGNVLQTRLGLLTEDDPLGDGGEYDSYEPESEDRDVDVCKSEDLRAVVNFEFGVTCGKRDSR